jgi:hypothetical protein
MKITFINEKTGKKIYWDGQHICNKVIDPATCCPIGHDPSLPDSKCTCIFKFAKDFGYVRKDQDNDNGI